MAENEHTAENDAGIGAGVKPYYQDDLVTLYHGDCRAVTDWLGADVLVTDPPYGMAHYLTTTARRHAHGDMQGDRDTAARDAVIAMWGDRPAVIFGHWRRPRPLGVRHLVVWDKQRNMAMGPAAPFATSHEEVYLLGGGFKPGRQQTVVRFRAPSSADHPTPKPVGLMEMLIACAPDGVVADPFAGSGSTLLAARNQGRRSVGVEFEERYCEVIAKRLTQDTLFGGAA